MGASARRVRATVSVRQRSAIHDTGLASSFQDSGASIGRRPGRLRAAWRMHRLRFMRTYNPTEGAMPAPQRSYVGPPLRRIGDVFALLLTTVAVAVGFLS